MTTVASHGFPDWGRQQPTSDIRVFETSGAAQNVISVIQGQFFVGNAPYLWLTSSVDNGGLRVGINWRDALVGGNLIASDAIDTLVGKSCTGPIAVKSPYAQIVTTIDAIGRIPTARVWTSHAVGQDHRGNLHNGLIVQDAININAGANLVVDSPNIRWGWGHWNAHLESADPFRIRLFALDYLGAAQLLAYWNNNNSPIATTFILPPRPIRIVVENFSGVAKNFFGVVYCHPGPL